MQQDQITSVSPNSTNAVLAADACPHKKGKVIEIGYTDNLPSITGDNSKYYDGYCISCEKKVYGQTGRKYIRWTTNREYAFSD